jgi:hypothetical protein
MSFSVKAVAKMPKKGYNHWVINHIFMKKVILIVIGAIVVIGGGIALMMQEVKNPNIGNPFAGKTSRELAMLCEPTEYVVMHVHPELSITINGEKQVIPANIGIEGVNGEVDHTQAQTQSSCLHFLHTHDATGKLHVESPIPMDYKLSDFFAVWGKEFSKDQILDSKIDATHRIRMVVNGQESTEYGDLLLKDLEKIEIVYEEIK